MPVIDGTAKRHCTVVSWSPLAHCIDQMVNKGNSEISPIVVFYRSEQQGCLHAVALYLTGSWFLHCDAQLQRGRMIIQANRVHSFFFIKNR